MDGAKKILQCVHWFTSIPVLHTCNCSTVSTATPDGAGGRRDSVQCLRQKSPDHAPPPVHSARHEGRSAGGSARWVRRRQRNGGARRAPPYLQQASDWRPAVVAEAARRQHPAHVDVRASNCVFARNPAESTLIDYDLCQSISTSRYVPNFNDEINHGKRHPQARAGQAGAIEHDLFSMEAVLALTEPWIAAERNYGRPCATRCCREISLLPAIC